MTGLLDTLMIYIVTGGDSVGDEVFVMTDIAASEKPGRHLRDTRPVVRICVALSAMALALGCLGISGCKSSNPAPPQPEFTSAPPSSAP